MLLVDEAEDWAESHSDVIELLNEENPTQNTIDSLRSLLCERFPAKAVEVTPVPFNVELAELQQRTDEPLSSYYKRVTGLMQRVGAKDRTAGIRLSLLESAMLDNIMRAFIKGMADHTIRQEAARSMVSTDRLLRNIYNVAEETRRANIEVQKLLNEELKADELDFYKQLAESNLPKQKINTLLTSYCSPPTVSEHASMVCLLIARLSFV